MIKTETKEHLETIPITRYQVKLVKETVTQLFCEICGKVMENNYGGAVLQYGMIRMDRTVNHLEPNDFVSGTKPWMKISGRGKTPEELFNMTYHHFHQTCIMRAINTYDPTSLYNAWAHDPASPERQGDF